MGENEVNYYTTDGDIIPRADCIHILAEVSKNAGWIKEGDVLTPEVINLYWQPGGRNSEDWNLVPFRLLGEGLMRSETWCVAKIKNNSCGHFH